MPDGEFPTQFISRPIFISLRQYGSFGLLQWQMLLVWDFLNIFVQKYFATSFLDFWIILPIWSIAYFILSNLSSFPVCAGPRGCGTGCFPILVDSLELRFLVLSLLLQLQFGFRSWLSSFRHLISIFSKNYLQNRNFGLRNRKKKFYQVENCYSGQLKNSVPINEIESVALFLTTRRIETNI